MDGRRLASLGFNVSVADERLALLLSLCPPTPNVAAAHSGLNASLSAQFKGQIIKDYTDVMVLHVFDLCTFFNFKFV